MRDLRHSIKYCIIIYTLLYRICRQSNLVRSMLCDTFGLWDQDEESERDARIYPTPTCTTHATTCSNFFLVSKNTNNNNNFPPIKIRFEPNNKHIEIHTFFYCFCAQKIEEKNRFIILSTCNKCVCVFGNVCVRVFFILLYRLFVEMWNWNSEPKRKKKYTVSTQVIKNINFGIIWWRFFFLFAFFSFFISAFFFSLLLFYHSKKTKPKMVWRREEKKKFVFINL